ncbi:hypothetical protein Pla144_05720 [Bythopirellula polymerisocia]|uniref:Uncharacterized protein n=1 Tax=Bythopirellula polymerisocia TaxID=2528003 RepID=A0A5C6CXV2_9BACT|nr:hypothetical protein Pla144_05720 [Bythopirellula polymerisocia]
MVKSEKLIRSREFVKNSGKIGRGGTCGYNGKESVH